MWVSVIGVFQRFVALNRDSYIFSFRTHRAIKRRLKFIVADKADSYRDMFLIKNQALFLVRHQTIFLYQFG